MRRTFVIAVLPNEIESRWLDWLQRLRSAIHAIPEADGDVICLAITSSDSAARSIKTDDRFSVLVDSDQRIRNRFLDDASQGGLIVADRYGMIFHSATGDPEQPELNPDDVPSWIELIACRCS